MSFRNVVEKLSEHKEPIRQPCSKCEESTLLTVLAQHGGWCVGCYDAYCREPQPEPPWMADKRTGGPRAWAYALRTREESGERLTPAQKAMWRAAIGQRPAP